MGLLDPATSDGRVIFFLPWQGATIAGTTDRKCDVTDNPSPTESDVQFILSEIQSYLGPDINGTVHFVLQLERRHCYICQCQTSSQIRVPFIQRGDICERDGHSYQRHVI